MFIGEFQHSIDQKGRLAIPSKFRKDLEKAVITRGLDGCLTLYPLKQWKGLAEKLSSLAYGQAKNRKMQRFFIAGAMDVSTDKQGRVMVPDYLRTHAHITKDVVVVGLFDRVEIWDTKAWEQHKKKTNKDADSIAEELEEFN